MYDSLLHCVIDDRLQKCHITHISINFSVLKKHITNQYSGDMNTELKVFIFCTKSCPRWDLSQLSRNFPSVCISIIMKSQTNKEIKIIWKYLSYFNIFKISKVLIISLLILVKLIFSMFSGAHIKYSNSNL